MTKEDIIGEQEYYSKKDVLLFMDIYAKQECINFLDDLRNFIDYEDNGGVMVGESRSSKEFYDRYVQSK